MSYYPPGYFNNVRIKGDHDGGPGRTQERKDMDRGNDGPGNSGGKGKDKDRGNH